MNTRMTSKVDLLDARVTAVESTLKNHESSLKEHTALLLGHTSSLNSLESNVAEMTKTLALMHAEMKRGFQQQFRTEGGKEVGEGISGASPSGSFVISGDRGEPVSSF